MHELELGGWCGRRGELVKRMIARFADTVERGEQSSVVLKS
jgi:hypothetical protein